MTFPFAGLCHFIHPPPPGPSPPAPANPWKGHGASFNTSPIILFLPLLASFAEYGRIYTFGFRIIFPVLFLVLTSPLRTLVPNRITARKKERKLNYVPTLNVPLFGATSKFPPPVFCTYMWPILKESILEWKRWKLTFLLALVENFAKKAIVQAAPFYHKNTLVYCGSKLPNIKNHFWSVTHLRFSCKISF